MENTLHFPSEDRAEALLQWAYGKNPGPWAEHSRVAARAGKAIAEQCGLDPHRAYVSGLLHDIGRYEGVRDLHHVYAGYDLMTRKGYTGVAEICLSHSFVVQNINAYSGKHSDCTKEELEVLAQYLSGAIYNDYDKLIQLCDAMCLPEGVCLIEVRLMDVARRHGLNSFTPQEWESIFMLKDYFDARCGMNLYDLFHDEIRTVSFL